MLLAARVYILGLRLTIEQVSNWQKMLWFAPTKNWTRIAGSRSERATARLLGKWWNFDKKLGSVEYCWRIFLITKSLQQFSFFMLDSYQIYLLKVQLINVQFIVEILLELLEILLIASCPRPMKLNDNDFRSWLYTLA